MSPVKVKPDPIRQALHDYLKADKDLMEIATGGLHYAQAPAGTETPYLIYGNMSEVPTRTFDGPSLDRDVWMVKGVGEAAQAETIDRLCRQLLDRATLDIAGRASLDVYRINKFSYVETDEGERFDHVGHEYKIDSEEVEGS